MPRRRPPVRQWMRQTRTSQASLAKQLGVSKPHMCNVLSGKRVLSVGKTLRLARISGVPVEKLLTAPELAEILENYGERQTSMPSESNDKHRVA